MKRCANRVTQMSEAIDGRLDSEAYAELMAHIESCTSCRRDDEALRQTVSTLRAVPPRDAPPDMAARVHRQLKQRPAVRFLPPVLHRPPIRIALAASLLIGISIYAFRRPTSPSAPELPEPKPMPQAETYEPGMLRESMEAEREHLSRRPRSPVPQPDAEPQPVPPQDVMVAPSPVVLRDIYARRSAPAPETEQPAADRRVAPESAGPARRMADDTGLRRGRRQEPGRDAVGFSALDALAEPPIVDALDMAGDIEARPMEAQAPIPQHLAERTLAFSADVYRKLAATQDGNLFFSPYSISSALTMAYAGARGNTAREMAAILHWPFDQAALHPAFRGLNRQVMAAARDSGQQLNIANGLCLTGGDVDTAYKTLLREYYEADIFTGGPAEINAWVARQTEGLIESIIDQLSPESVCVLLNAVYFKGTWQDAFDPGQTRDAPFYRTPDHQVTVPLMTRQGRYRWLEDDKFNAIAIPYQGENLSMIVVLPRANGDITLLEDQLTAQTLETWRTGLKQQPPREVRLYLPKFKFETDYGLVSPMRRLGMRDAFVEGVADFTGMGWPKGELWISQIKHKAFVEVNEEGTEAAAATAVEMRTTSIQPPPPVFRADRPFLFMIQDNQTGSILFMGRLRDPTVAK